MDYKLQKFDIENVGAIKRFRCELHGGSAIFAGAPNAGKTTILETLQYLITGKATDRFAPEKMANRDGGTTSTGADAEAEALFRADDGQAFTCRMVVKDGKPTLKVVGVKNKTDRMTRADVKDMIHSIGIDLCEFRRLKPKEQVDKLLEGLGLKSKLDALNVQREAAYNDRRDINRDIKNLKGELEGAEAVPADLPAQKINDLDLLKRLEDANKSKTRRMMLEESIKRAEADILRWRGELAAIKNTDDPAALTAEIAKAQTVNRQIDERERLGEKYTRLMDLETESETKSETIAEIDAEKQEIIESANLPIKGLSFGDDGLAIDGKPLINEGESMGLRQTFALCAALLNRPSDTPKLRLITMDGGESVGKSGTKEVLALSKEFNVPVLITYVSEDAGEIENAIYIQEAGK